MLSRLPSALSVLFLVTCIDAAPYKSLKHPSRSSLVSRSTLPGNQEGLPATICGVVGGYVLTVLIWGVLLLTVGRRMRRKTENSPKTLELELINTKPTGNALPTPRSARSWFKKSFKKDDSAIGSPTSPVVHSPNSFDRKVLDADRERAQADMERLYAAVMEHDKKKSYSQVSVNEHDLEDRKLAPIDTSQGVPDQSNPTSPVKAIYPPGYNNSTRDRLRDQEPSSPRSILSKKSQASQASTSSKARFNLKNLRISGPIQKYPGEQPGEEARTPLSPRFYNPGAPPSPPTAQASPTTPGEIEEAYEGLDEVQPLPRTQPQRMNSYPSNASTPTSATAPKSAASSTNALPLRGYAEPLKSPDLRTTVLDRRVDKLSMTTPKTGVPYTPYSPYMPFTPLTPVTPHLVTKKERKSARKVEGRKVKRSDDMVQSPKEIFGDAY